jgi:predicted cation transporter
MSSFAASMRAILSYSVVLLAAFAVGCGASDLEKSDPLAAEGLQKFENGFQ